MNITTEWLESVGCKISAPITQEEAENFYMDSSCVGLVYAVDVDGNHFANKRDTEDAFSNFKPHYKPRFRVRAISQRGW